MAIEVQQEIQEEKNIFKKEKLLLIIFWIVIIFLFLGTLIFYMFFSKPPENLIKTFSTNDNYLTKEEIAKIENILNQIEKNEINKFRKIY